MVMNWLRSRDEGISGSYDFAEGVPVWKTGWFRISTGIGIIAVAGILAVFLMGWF